MESNLPVIANRVWNIIRFAFYMLRKGISKGKLMMDLNMVLIKRRGKLAGKAITNLMAFHHDTRLHQFSTTREYEFSCSNTPSNNLFSIIGSKRHHRHNHFLTRAHAPTTCDDEAVTVSAVKAVLEMLNNEAVVEASPGYQGSVEALW